MGLKPLPIKILPTQISLVLSHSTAEFSLLFNGGHVVGRHWHCRLYNLGKIEKEFFSVQNHFYVNSFISSETIQR